jgi:peptide-methionine (S)-S-oxide reductase
LCPCSCFWGLELAFQRVPGVVKTSVGYSGGKSANPTYDEVCMGFTGHTEVVQCTYDPDQVRHFVESGHSC